ncbi:tRNA isopentenyl-2-thiomethyl-A-37 hydroxylase MiaE [Shewanella marina]|uniref:tRNA isopentenyl-2-thiomethyl-A-37 hydroxylase MiaE n=1 Tax=Shewanella marina TaxID=487319 RepID=UPI000471ABC8|nr:tRNA isopentenyl-2-thiomethyl-A-37 hydroxylase MiaE [Shewanella marina]
MAEQLSAINQFLHCGTPNSWIEYASQPAQLTTLLIDHCNCELKAAQSAIYLLRHYALTAEQGRQLQLWVKPYEQLIYWRDRDVTQFVETASLLHKQMPKLNAPNDPFERVLVEQMMLLVKEEFHHFQQVLEIMLNRGIDYQNLNAGTYAKQLLSQLRTYEPMRLIDRLIIGALIEARSCERFAKLAPYLEQDLSRFYQSLLRSEARHFQDYLNLAQLVAKQHQVDNVEQRIDELAEIEASLVVADDPLFRFHSGVPV